MRYHFFLHYGWFFQNLGKEAVRTFMHTTVFLGLDTSKSKKKVVVPETQILNENWQRRKKNKRGGDNQDRRKKKGYIIR